MTASSHADLLQALKPLRAFAMSLTGSLDEADDLVQETILRALANAHQFRPGTSLNAWLFTILRNAFHTRYRKRQREVEDPDGSYMAGMISPPSQMEVVAMEELRAALLRLPVAQREAVLLMAAGVTLAEAASICGVMEGTIKSRVGRGRAALAQALSISGPDDLGPDPVTRAMLQEQGAG